MSWFTENAGDIASLFILALGFLGVYVAFVPNIARRRERWYIGIGFVVVAAVAWYADKVDRRATEARLTGGDNYCYFQADLSRPQPKGGYEWKLINKKQRPIPNVQICLYLNGKFSRCWKQGMCIPHSVDQAKDEGPLPIGEHRFEFFAANRWSQTLEIYMEGETPKQRGEIIRDGKEIWRFPDVSR